jgi:CHRD domain
MARRTGLVLVLAFVGAVALVVASVGVAGGGKSKKIEAKLTGYEEVPAINTAGKGKIKLRVRNGTSAGTIEFKLTYSNLTSPATAAHIHFGQESVNGGIAVHFCGTGGKPACPAGNTSTKVTVEGTAAAADVVAITAQGLAAGDMASLQRAIKAGVAYVNVHSTPFPGGEIRAQLDRRGDDDD